MIPDGILLKGSSPAVYLMEHGMKRPFVDGQSFYHYKFKWERVVHAPDSFVHRYNTGRDISYRPPFRLNSPGTLLVSGDATIKGVYLLYNDVLYGFKTQAIFERLKYQFDEVLSLPDTVILFLPKGEEISTPFVAGKIIPGRLFYAPDQNLYYSDNGILRQIKGQNTFQFFKWKEADVIPLTMQEWHQAAKGAAIHL